MTLAFKFAEGDQVRVVKPYPEENLGAGQLCVIEFTYDDVPEEIDEPIYALSSETGGWSGKECPESHLELVRTWKQMMARKMPTPQEILSSLDLLGYNSSDLEYNESDVGSNPAGDSIELYGKTAEGLTFGCEMQVVRVWRTDF